MMYFVPYFEHCDEFGSNNNWRATKKCLGHVTVGTLIQHGRISLEEAEDIKVGA